MKLHLFVSLLTLVLLAAQGLCAEGVVVKKALSVAATAGENRLQNGRLETVAGGQFVGVGKWDLGYTVEAQGAHSGKYTARCTNAGAEEARGISFRVDLNQRNALPITVEAWSRAEKVSGGADSGYSLYVDLEYVDGTPLWGQVAAFDTGTHGWQKRTVTIIPSQPVRNVTVHGLLRQHTGTAWFDDFRLSSPESTGRFGQFDAIPVEAVPPAKRPVSQLALQVSPHFNLRLAADGAVVTQAVGGFLLRDVAAGSDFVRPQGAWHKTPQGVSWEAKESRLKLKLSVTYRKAGEALRIDGTVQDLSGADRAVTIYFTYPVAAASWQWHDDARTSRPIQAGQQYQNVVNIGAGANGSASRYPLACISGTSDAVALAAPLDVPRLVRFGYDASAQELYAAVDLGLSRGVEKSPSTAGFSLVLYRPEPAWGFRSALEHYYRLFPQCFTKRNTKEGLWMPFSDIEKVQGWEDFGFQFKEGDGNVPFDHAHGISSFVYVEPMSWWLALPKEVERTPARAFAYAQEQAAAGKPEAKAALVSAEQDAQGNWVGDIRNTPWCDGIVYYLNPSPALGRTGSPSKYRLNWQGIDDSFRANPGLSGVYVDSFEMAADLRNYRREHFRTAETPLVFDREGRLCQLGIFNTTEFAKDLATRLWGRGRMTFANSLPIDFPWGAAWFDVMGIEMDWTMDGKYRPPSDATLSYFRAMADQRPYLLLQNTRFEDFPKEWVDKYMQRSTAYGIFPSFFSHNASDDPYWQRPDLYNRDRPLFLRYLPVIKTLSAAGWQPVTRARADDAKVFVERFGQAPGAVYYTLFNDRDRAVQVQVTFETPPTKLTEVLSGRLLAAPGGKLTAELGPEQVWVLRAE
jgi:hypothetical protein